MYPQRQPGDRIGPALIALIAVLAAAAGTVGYLGARQIMAADQSRRPASGPGSDEVTTRQPGGEAGPATGPGPTGPGQPVAGPADGACPAITGAAVRGKGLPGSLRLVLHIEGRRANAANAEVWICRNSAGTLFYQGWVKSAAFTAATSDNTLLLGDGVRGNVVKQGAGFLATDIGSASRTEYRVTQEQLTQQTFPDGPLIVYQVIDVDLP